MSDVYPATPLGSPPAQAAVTPGQAAYAVMHRASGVDVPHEDLDDDDKRLWDDIAAAVMLMAQAAVDYAELQMLRGERDKAYRERAALVAHLAACYPSVMLTDSAEPDWPIVFVMTPAGQMSWHVAAADVELFGHVPATTEPTWDGHATEVKYERLAELVRAMADAAGIRGIGLKAGADALAEGIAERDGLRDLIGEILAYIGTGRMVKAATAEVWRQRAGLDGAVATAPAPAVAPELAAAMAETRTVRDGYQALCGEFGPSAQSGWSARISLTILNRHRAAAGLDRFSRTESNDREDITMRYRRERDEAREQLAAMTLARDTLLDDAVGLDEQLATTQAIARMLQATAIEILAAYQSGTVVSGELLGIWRERLGTP